jgi:peptidyl-tRNA hydrolase
MKQVIVMRKDLKMRRGKEIAQGAHASMAFLAKKALAGEAFHRGRACVARRALHKGLRPRG